MENCEIVERRKNYPEIHIKLATIETKLEAVDNRINGSIKDIDKHIASGSAWRMAIIGTIAIFIMSLLLQVGSFLYVWGRLTSIVERNTSDISKLEAMFPRTQGAQGIQGIAGKDSK